MYVSISHTNFSGISFGINQGFHYSKYEEKNKLSLFVDYEKQIFDNNTNKYIYVLL